MSDRLPSEPSEPKVFVDDSSVFTARELTIGKVKGSINFETVCNGGSQTSGNACQQVPNADRVATGGSYINTDRIICEAVDGDMNFSVKTGNPQVREGTVGETLPSSMGPAVKMITEHKVELISYLMPDPSFILQHVQAKGIITDRQYTNIMSVSQPEESVTKLIDHVIFKGEEACSCFLDILKVPEVLSTYRQLKDIVSKWR